MCTVPGTIHTTSPCPFLSLLILFLFVFVFAPLLRRRRARASGWLTDWQSKEAKRRSALRWMTGWMILLGHHQPPPPACSLVSNTQQYSTEPTNSLKKRKTDWYSGCFNTGSRLQHSSNERFKDFLKRLVSYLSPQSNYYQQQLAVVAAIKWDNFTQVSCGIM